MPQNAGSAVLRDHTETRKRPTGSRGTEPALWGSQLSTTALWGSQLSTIDGRRANLSTAAFRSHTH